MHVCSCLHYVLGSCSIHSVFTAIQLCHITTYSIYYLYCFVFLLSKEPNRNETVNAMDVTAIQTEHIFPQSPAFLTSFLFEKEYWNPSTSPLPSQYRFFPVFSFHYFIYYNASSPVVFESSFTVSHNSGSDHLNIMLSVSSILLITQFQESAAENLI